MKVLQTTACVLMLVALVACEPAQTYPISGEACGPDDPVQSLDAADCVI